MFGHWPVMVLRKLWFSDIASLQVGFFHMLTKLVRDKTRGKAGPRICYGRDLAIHRVLVLSTWVVCYILSIALVISYPFVPTQFGPLFCTFSPTPALLTSRDLVEPSCAYTKIFRSSREWPGLFFDARIHWYVQSVLTLARKIHPLILLHWDIFSHFKCS